MDGLTADKIVKRFELKRRTSWLHHVEVGIKVGVANGKLRPNHECIAVDGIDEVSVPRAQWILVYNGKEAWTGRIEAGDSANRRT